MQIVWWIIFGVSIINYVALAAFILPKMFFKAGAEIPSSYDRGLKNYKHENGRSIVYEPQSKYKKYVSQYIISEQNGIKGIICKINGNLKYLDYDIVLFNDNNKAFQTINVKENIVDNGYTSFMELPPQTMYASIFVNMADNARLYCRETDKISNKKLALFLAVTSILVIFEAFCAQICFANIFGDVFVESFTTSAEAVIVTLIIGLLAVAINVATAVLAVKIRNKRKWENLAVNE